MNKKTVGRVAAIERRPVLQVSEIEAAALLSVHESLLCWILATELENLHRITDKS